jgi:hypothetical protein
MGGQRVAAQFPKGPQVNKIEKYHPSDDWKFADGSRDFHVTIGKIIEMGYSELDYIHHNPAFAGTVNIARFLSVYEIYKNVMTLSGDIAEVGVFKGSTFLYFAKLLEIFEPHSYTRVHGFDWFEGMDPSADETGLKPGAYKTDYERLLKLVELQNLSHIAKVHKLDVTKDLEAFFDERKGMVFKLVFLDAGTYDVVRAALPYFWPRLGKGGYLILDQYADLRTHGETRAVDEFFDDVEIKTFPWSRHPTAYIRKE